MDNNRYKFDKGYELSLPLWIQVRAAIRGKQGALLLLDGDYHYGLGLISPLYRVTDSNANTVDKRRRAYFARGRFFNATGRTHDAYVGMISAIPVEHEYPDQLLPFVDNVDGEDATLIDFANEMTSEVLTTARYGILVDPADLSGGTLTDAAMRLPKFVGYKAEQMPRVVVDKGILVFVELIETYWIKIKEDYELKEQRRILELIGGKYTSRITREGEEFEAVTPTVNGAPLNYIPFHFVGSENNKATYDRPVMFDLAHENMGHFQLSCDNLENLHYHGQGMTNVFTSMTPEDFASANPNGMDVGAKGVNQLAQGDKVEILQLEATGAIPAEMDRVQKRMIMLGAQVVQDSATNQTLGAKEIEASASTSQLKRIAINGSQALTQCSKWAAEMMGITDTSEIKVTLNNTFVADELTPQDVQVMFAMYQGGAATFDELSEVKRKANYTQLTNEEIKTALANQMPVAGDSEEVATLKMELDNLKAANNQSAE